MASVQRLAVGRIVFIPIPGEEPHPAVVVLELADGCFMVSGTGTPEEGELPIVTLSEAAAHRCGLHKQTMFYGTSKYVWYVRTGQGWEPSGDKNMDAFPSYIEDLRAAAIGVLRSFKNPLLEVQKAPDGIGVTLTDAKQVRALASATRGDNPETEPRGPAK